MQSVDALAGNLRRALPLHVQDERDPSVAARLAMNVHVRVKTPGRPVRVLFCRVPVCGPVLPKNPPQALVAFATALAALSRHQHKHSTKRSAYSLVDARSLISFGAGGDLQMHWESVGGWQTPSLVHTGPGPVCFRGV